jgi:hypothetical protein
MREPKQAGEPALAVLDRFAPEVFAVHLEEVERAEYRGRIAPVRADELEHGQAAVAADYGLAVEDARADGQRLNRFRDERKRSAKLWPLQEKSRTARPRRCARIRKPSCLIS